VTNARSTDLPNGTVRGTIARLRSDKGFGFIKGPQGIQYFFHKSAVRDSSFDTLSEGDAVTFLPDESESGKGPRAEEVRKA